MNLFNKIKDSVSISQVIGEYTQLKKAGGSYLKGTCPFHNEKTGSFTVSPDRGIFYCFGCHVTGDVIAFIAQIEHIGQFEAAKHLIERYNLSIPLDELKQQNPQAQEQKSNYFDLCKGFAQWSHQQLLQNHKALEYLATRGISKEIILKHALGFFPAGTQSIQQCIKSMAYHKAVSADLVNAHILFQGQQGLHSPFENRIIFPIFDHLGRACGFGGRVFLPGDERVKYYNSKENEFFQKGHILFGLDKAKKDIQQKNNSIIVEGYLDCLAMHQHGYTNTVATLGTACTVDHLQLLARYTNKISIMFDGDAAGQKAMLRLAQICWEVDVDLNICSLPANTDPDSFLKNHNTIDPVLAHQEDIFTFFLKSLSLQFANQALKEKLQISSSILDIIQQIKDPLKRNILLGQASEKLQIPLEILQKQYTKHKVPTSSVALKETNSQEDILLNHIPVLDQRLCAAMLQKPERIARYEFMTMIYSFHDRLQPLLYALTENNEISDEYFKLQHRLICLYPEIQDDEFESILEQFHKKHWKSIILHIKLKLQEAQNAKNILAAQKLVEQFQKLKQKFIKFGRV
ncbi:DNA primase [bacterium]|nr:DNA primase [bacterium]